MSSNCESVFSLAEAEDLTDDTPVLPPPEPQIESVREPSGSITLMAALMVSLSVDIDVVSATDGSTVLSDGMWAR
jgi:hypothetical protein